MFKKRQETVALAFVFHACLSSVREILIDELSYSG